MEFRGNDRIWMYFCFTFEKLSRHFIKSLQKLIISLHAIKDEKKKWKINKPKTKSILFHFVQQLKIIVERRKRRRRKNETQAKFIAQ